MRYRKKSNSGDYTFGNSLKDFYINVPAAPGQAVQTRLQLATGEWFLDLSQGTPYIDGILAQKNTTQADNIIKNRTLKTQGIVSILSYESSFNPTTRAFSVVEKVETIYGNTVITTEGTSVVPVFPTLSDELITQSGYVLTTESGDPITRQR